MNDYLQVGVITSTHGIRGEVKVFPTTDDPKRFLDLEKVILDTEKEKLELEIEQVKFFKQFVILKFKGYENINDVEAYKKKSLLVSREDAVELGQDEYFIADLIGLRVVSDKGEDLGKLTEVLSTGANDVYVTDGGIFGKEILIPAIRQCILEVDLERRTMNVHLLEGLVDGR